LLETTYQSTQIGKLRDQIDRIRVEQEEIYDKNAQVLSDEIVAQRTAAKKLEDEKSAMMTSLEKEKKITSDIKTLLKKEKELRHAAEGLAETHKKDTEAKDEEMKNLRSDLDNLRSNADNKETEIKKLQAELGSLKLKKAEDDTNMENEIIKLRAELESLKLKKAEDDTSVFEAISSYVTSLSTVISGTGACPRTQCFKDGDSVGALKWVKKEISVISDLISSYGGIVQWLGLKQLLHLLKPEVVVIFTKQGSRLLLFVKPMMFYNAARTAKTSGAVYIV